MNTNISIPSRLLFPLVLVGAFSAALTSVFSAAAVAQEEGPAKAAKDRAAQPFHQEAEPRLEVAPDSNPDVGHTPDRPDWVENGKDQVTRRKGIDEFVVLSGPWTRSRDRQKDLQEKLKQRVDRYINEYLERPRAATLLNYSADQIKNRMVNKSPQYNYLGRVHTSVGARWEEAYLVQVDPSFRRELDQRWNQVVATSRLTSMSLIAGGVLGLLAIVFAFFRIDTATRGFYTWRLQLLALIVILGMIGAGVMIARYMDITWL